MKFIECYKPVDDKKTKFLTYQVNSEQIVSMYPAPTESLRDTFIAMVKTTDGETYWLDKSNELTQDAADNSISSTIEAINS